MHKNHMVIFEINIIYSLTLAQQKKNNQLEKINIAEYMNKNIVNEFNILSSKSYTYIIPELVQRIASKIISSIFAALFMHDNKYGESKLQCENPSFP